MMETFNKYYSSGFNFSGFTPLTQFLINFLTIILISEGTYENFHKFSSLIYFISFPNFFISPGHKCS